MTQTSQRIYLLCGSLLLLLMAGCSSRHHRPAASYNPQAYDGIIQTAAAQYNLDPKLIKAIIQVESSYNPRAVSPSNAIGLMQIKADGAGCDAYRYQGKRGCPDSDDLYDPVTNIRLGAAYLSALQNQQLYWINDPLTRRYATEVAYANGAGALLRTFSANRQTAIAMINSLTPAAFHWHVRRHHPAPQAPRYMLKVETAYNHL
ncbi:transglycosylase SLT domain-containing protein [Edwardsiella piscicida]|uniref:transglycosylase SLT domain-containing protein n=1 Tax=Edwardsiella piscicida TaxID=1263550 RepID=UPI00084CDFD7|nr:transglycosylase SLT domain-containing protein [Edwardsiella piscicida]AOP43896.1 transglycosylase SLT domain-containing protein [Edwardsiella piscicida]EKS7766408.1 transglycosylase SLT domain-containing protein [Edwardsiella piscicida]EKS7812813.1 transglycosylase SLT domain-containing protein [Edwardsiella piscicida]ELM3723873.1 transglycosylase SLT domain-containing protein [Edwardsiella piscicida]UCQ20362.1 transglycosylase SLT domain-containing protein [Edwardsiella piscicida]